VDVPGAGWVSVVSVHLAGTPEERMLQADEVTRVFADAPHPVVLAGDFNGRPDDPVVVRLTRDWRVFAKNGGRYTYPSDAPDREIDFVMARNGDPIVSVDHHVVDESVASDHRPLLAVLEVGRPER
jgi:endonuclease/exonuclease/phosphatase family metal-dependent hydrolase